MRHETNKRKKEKHMKINRLGDTKVVFLIFFLILEFTPLKLELNIVLNVKQKQELIMSTPLRLIKSSEVAPMNMARFGGKDVKKS